MELWFCAIKRQFIIVCLVFRMRQADKDCCHAGLVISQALQTLVRFASCCLAEMNQQPTGWCCALFQLHNVESSTPGPWQ